jgi:hypothetical protein
MTCLNDQIRILSRILALHSALPTVLTSEQYQAVFWISEMVHDGHADQVGPELWAALVEPAQLLEAAWTERQEQFVHLLTGARVDLSPFGNAREVRAQLAAAPQVVRT